MCHCIETITNISAEKSIGYFKLLLTIGLFYGARMRYVNSLVYGRIHLPLMDGSSLLNVSLKKLIGFSFEFNEKSSMCTYTSPSFIEFK